MKKLITLCLVLSGVAAWAQQGNNPKACITWEEYEPIYKQSLERERKAGWRVIRLPTLPCPIKWIRLADSTEKVMTDSTEIILPEKPTRTEEGEAFKHSPTVRLPHKRKIREKPAPTVTLPHKVKKGEKTKIQLL